MAEKPFGLKNPNTARKYFQHADRYGDWLGYKIESMDDEKFEAKTSIVVREDHLSPANHVHGGVVSSFFDFSCGVAVFCTLGAEDVCSTVELKVNYFKPLDLGDRLHALSRVVFRGKKICVVHSMLYRGQEPAPVAMATGTFNVVRK